jgi:hypothetical protein
MDINILNSGTPGTKNFLNPICNSLTCNNITSNIVSGINTTPVQDPSPKLFQIGTSVGVNIPLISTTTPANVVVINNPYISIGSNTYVATSDQYLQVTVSYTLVPPIAASDITGVSNCTVLVNSGISLINCSCYTGVTVADPVSLICSGVLRLAPGDVVSVSFVNTGFGAGWRYRAFCFTGVIL